MGGMGFSRRFLGEGESVIVRLRTHAKALVGPVVALLLIGVLAGVAAALIPAGWQPWGGWAVAAVLTVIGLWQVVGPFLRWLTTTYTLTNRRIITRRGIIVTRGHDLPLSRIVNVEYERGFIDKIFGCGTLILTTAAEEPLVLHDIPDVERVHVLMTELLFSGREHDDSSDSSGASPHREAHD